MEALRAETEQTTIREIVSEKKVDAVSAAIVHDEDATRLSLLAEKENPLGERVHAKSHSGSHGKNVKGADAQTDQAATDTSVLEAEAEAKQSPLKVRQILMRKAVDELDDSDELEGSSSVYDSTRSAKRLSNKLRASKSRKARGAQEAGAASKSAGKGKSVGAAGAEKKAAQAGTNQVAGSASTASLAQSAPVAAQAAAGAESTAAVGAIGGSGAAAAGGVICGIVAFIICALVIGQVISSLFGFWENEAKKASLEGLPPYITYEMVEEAIKCQEEYGHPAGCTIAQIICESGQGDHMSQLATRDHNLFGMKWASSFASAPEVTGKSGWSTKEEYTPGVFTTITAYFTVFKGDAECIRFRSRVFLQSGTYRNNDLIKQAISEKSSDKMAEGLKAAGWATSSTYVESLKSIMDTYDLRRFDSMSVSDLQAGALNGDAVVKAAYTQLGVPYVWGGTTPGVGLDCSGLTQYCYSKVGIYIPHNTESQYAAAKRKVPISQASPGDVLYKNGHVAIYIGDDKYIHEPHSGAVCTLASGASGYFTCALKFR